MDTWKRDQSAGIRLYAPLRERGRAHLVRFEDLLERSEETLGGLCAFLGIEYSPRMLEFYQESDVIENARRIGAWQDLSRPLMKDNHGLYQGKLSRDAIEYIEAVCGEEMDFLGYAREYPPAGNLNALRRQMALRPVPPLVRTPEEEAVYAAFFAANRRIEGRNLLTPPGA